MKESELNSALCAALEQLGREFPQANFLEVRAEARKGWRRDNRPKTDWDSFWWTVQVNNDRASGDSVDAAISSLRKDLDENVRINERAERIAEILREDPDTASRTLNTVHYLPYRT